jgi:hypothetical protein
MPLILNLAEREIWLSGDDEVDGLGESVRLRHHPVGKFGACDNGPSLIEHI